MNEQAKTGNEYKLAAIDLDGTLLAPDKTIHPDNLRAIDLLRARGIEIVLASGRRYENMLRFHRALDLTGPIIACQGAFVRQPGGHSIHEQVLPPPLALDVVQFARSLDSTMILYAQKGTYAERVDRFVELYEERAAAHVTIVKDVAQVLPIWKIILNQDPERVPEIFDMVQKRYGTTVSAVVTNPESVEVLPAGVDKAKAVALVAKRLGLSRKHVLAFGDGDNDVQMLRWAGLGVAMSDCTPAARDAARVQAPSGDPATSLARAVAQL